MNFKSTIREISKVVAEWDGPIVVAYSGGKDSSAVLKLVFNAVATKSCLAKKVYVIYCDTKVENPILDDFVKRTLRRLKKEISAASVNLEVKILTPALDQRYFVRTIGRGYPPPTSFFRWCTKDLRIRPVQRFVRSLGERALILVGTRRGESAQRDRVFVRAGDDRKSGPIFQRQMDGGRETILYLPIARYSLADVWECLAELPNPTAIDTNELAEVYRFGGGECPVVRDTNDKPCASARFGCWVCTVVRRDKSSESLLAAGFDQLGPYMQFRSWISEIRNDMSTRCEMRRNGQIGPGPFRLKTRKMILAKVRKLEKKIGQTLITETEERFIKRLWTLDKSSEAYLEMEAFSVPKLGRALA